MGLKFELLKFAHVSFLFDIEHRKKPKLAGPQKCDRSLRGSFEFAFAGAEKDQNKRPVMTPTHNIHFQENADLPLSL